MDQPGTLKTLLPSTNRAIQSKLQSYFGTSPTCPTVSLRTPHHYASSPLPSRSPSPNPVASARRSKRAPHPHLSILLLSSADSRAPLVDLTRTLAAYSQSSKLDISDITTNLIDASLTESLGREPDLVMLFGGKICLDGYPPWQLRLSEIWCLRDHEGGVEYHVFLRGLKRYSGAEFRVGR